MVAQHRTKLGPCAVMRHNPHNGVVCLGHARGCVTMWTPNLTTPAVKMLCHRVGRGHKQRRGREAWLLQQAGHNLTAGSCCLRVVAVQGPVTALAVDQGGTYMATAGSDSQIKARRRSRAVGTLGTAGREGSYRADETGQQLLRKGLAP
jgi:U3 small nucleolar RNA-associated protein 7